MDIRNQTFFNYFIKRYSYILKNLLLICMVAKNRIFENFFIFTGKTFDAEVTFFHFSLFAMHIYVLLMNVCIHIETFSTSVTSRMASLNLAHIYVISRMSLVSELSHWNYTGTSIFKEELLNLIYHFFLFKYHLIQQYEKRVPLL